MVHIGLTLFVHDGLLESALLPDIPLLPPKQQTFQFRFVLPNCFSIVLLISPEYSSQWVNTRVRTGHAMSLIGNIMQSLMCSVICDLNHPIAKNTMTAMRPSVLSSLCLNNQHSAQR